MLYRFETNCISSDYASIRSLIAAQQDISRQAFARRIGTAQWRDLQQTLGYDRHFPISRDWHVGYYESVYRGVPAVFLRHSGIEWIFVQGEPGEPPADEDEDEGTLGAAPEWDEDYAAIPAYARGYKRVRVPVSQIASPFFNPIKDERIEQLAALEDAGYTLPPIIVDGPGEVEEVDYPEERYPFLDGHYPEVGEEVWFVHDGHHRTLLALQRGDRFIDALVMG